MVEKLYDGILVEDVIENDQLSTIQRLVEKLSGWKDKTHNE